MCAYSLRTWRRNGVACDELLFLPGTAHGETHGIDDPTADAAGVARASTGRSEGDVAAGGVGWHNSNTATETVVEEQEGLVTPAPPSESQRQRSAIRHKRAVSMASSLDDSIQEFANSWDQDDYDNASNEDEQLRIPLTGSRDSDDSPHRTGPTTSRQRGESDDASLSPRSITNRTVFLEIGGGGVGEDTPPLTRQQERVQRFRENHPRITRIGSFFFFRSSATSTHSAEYAPSGPSVVGAAIDLCMPILFNFHLFIEAYNHISSNGSETPAKILPLIFLSVLIVRSFFPPSRRGRFWNIMKITFMAPFHRLRLRDSFVGDCLTSLIRPCQDVLFALSYYVTVIYGTVTGHYGLSDSGAILESSWILHNVVLPSCALLPLWWKFLQTLRECYDTGKRWPALGNALKYLTASLVILYGMTHPEDRRSPWWLVSFALACIYQIWWDTQMDWELFVIAPRQDETSDLENSWYSRRISSLPADSHMLLFLQRYIFQPVRDVSRFLIIRFRFFKQIQLRPTRLYKTDSFYWKIFFYNTALRFTWMLCFIPAYHLSPSGHEHVTTFSSDTNSYVGVLLPVAEILRRTLWGFLLLERETICMMDGDPKYDTIDNSVNLGEDSAHSQMSLDTLDSSKVMRQYVPTWLGAQQQLQHEAATSSSSSRLQGRCLCFDDEMRHKLFVAELSVWALMFVGLGLWATGD